MKSEIIVDRVEINGMELSVHYHCHGDITSVLNGDVFTASYNHKLDRIPDSMLIIPFLANVCPIAWVFDATIYCKEIDFRFFTCLEKVRESFQLMYPEIPWVGEVNPEFIVNNEKNYQVNARSGLFFTGGVASVSSYVQRRHERPLLITVRGADQDLSEEDVWQPHLNRIEKFGSDHGTEVSVITSNFRAIMDEETLTSTYDERLGGTWWEKVQIGLGMIGLAAPISYYHKLSTVYFSANQNPSYLQAAGSHPQIDSRIHWGSHEFRVIHQGYALTRHEKLTILSYHINKYDSTLQLHVCTKSEDHHNCSTCDQCYWTILSLLVEGIDPSEHGFEKIDAAKLTDIRMDLEQREFFSPLHVHQYNDIRKNATRKLDNLPEYTVKFFTWFENFNLNQVDRKTKYKEMWFVYKKKLKNKIQKSEKKADDWK
ncbi:hypothetical protein NC661_20150 [Aquibacillus koreensis]|uniref:Uncharacterized protein n=1 Tax=Aquibacillus koreensis TaxID=279446 RepID=A0A9X3WPD9_9BACI|nr:hypothetical protein [Aquibacillus koreensis]MCT2537902.1 hypothetical protein [Aquibacillus koreensis]MDC3422670.1 hypothetical protein [Aquibacillus koreensis]